MMSTIFTQGEKIKNIRKQLGLSQQDIVDSRITRNMISIIENDKAKLSPSVAKIVAENINRICSNKGIDFNLTEEYLLQSIEIQARTLIEKHCEYIESHNKMVESELDTISEDIDSIFTKYKLPELAGLTYYKVARKYGDLKAYQDSYTYYLKSLENNLLLITDIFTIKLLSEIAFTTLKLSLYDDSIKYINTALQNFSDTENRLFFILHFNAALAYKKKLIINKCLNELDTIENRCKGLNDSDKFEVYTLKANCLKAEKRYSDALDLNLELLTLIPNKDIEKKLVTFSNILDLYSVLNDTQKLKIYLSKSTDLLASYSQMPHTPYTCQVLFEYSKAFLKIGNRDSAIEYCKKALMAARAFKNLTTISSTLSMMFELYKVEKNTDEIGYVKNLLIEYMSNELIAPGHPLIFQLLKHYNDANDSLSIDNILQFILAHQSTILLKHN